MRDERETKQRAKTCENKEERLRGTKTNARCGV